MSELFPLHGFVLRSGDDEDPLDGFVHAVKVARVFLDLRGCRVGGKPVPLALTRSEIQDALQRPEALFGPVQYALGEDDGLSFLSYRIDRTFVPRRYPTIELRLGNEACGLNSVEQIIEMFGAVASAFGARLGGLHHPDQKAVALARALAADNSGVVLPPGAAAAPTEPPAGIDPAHLSVLSTGAHPRTFDRARALESMWWTSFVGEEALTSWVAERFRSCSFHASQSIPGGTVFVVTERPPKLGEDSGWARLAELAEALDLRRWQSRAARTTPWMG